MASMHGSNDLAPIISGTHAPAIDSSRSDQATLASTPISTDQQAGLLSSLVDDIDGLLTSGQIDRTSAKTTELTLYGITARTGTLIVTDGQDNSSRLGAADVAMVVADLVGTRHHVIEGIYRGQANPSTFASMGIPEDWIKSGGESKDELLNEFARFSQASMSEFTDGDKLNAGVTIG